MKYWFYGHEALEFYGNNERSVDLNLEGGEDYGF
jgi:hypothetical protein